MEHRYAASAIIYNSDGLVLLARRAPTKFPFPNTLSLPSTYIRDCTKKLATAPLPDAQVQEQLRNAVRLKLGIEITIRDIIGRKEGLQADYSLTMTDYFAQISSGIITPNTEDFSEAAFFNPIEPFGHKKRDRMGFCTQILLETLARDPLFWKKYF